MAQRMHGAATLAAGTSASRILGFVRDMLLAYLLGPGADPFLVAFRVPNFFRRLLAEGSLGMAHGAAVSRILCAKGARAAEAFTRSVCVRLFAASLPVAVLLACLATPLVFALAPGMASQAASMEKSARILQLCLPYLPLCAVSAIAFAHASAFGDFYPQAWSSFLLNCALLILGGIALVLYGDGAAFAPELYFGLNGAELLLCSGVACGGLLQVLLGLRSLRPAKRPCLVSAGDFQAPASSGERASARERVLPAAEARPHPARSGATPDAPEESRSLRGICLSALGAAPHQLHLLAGAVLASFLAPGGISSLYFAERLFELPLGVIGVAVSLAALPRLAMQAAAKAMADFAATLADSLRFCAFFCFPAAAGLYALALPLTQLLFGHGAFAGEQAACTAAALRAYALGLPAMCATRPLLAASHALALGNAPLRIAGVSLLCLVPVSFAGMQMFSNSPPAAAAALTFGLSVGAWINALLLLRLVRGKGLPCPVRARAKSLVAYGGGALLMACALSAIAKSCAPLPAGMTLALIAAALVLWIGLFYLARNEDARSLPRLLRSSRKKEA